MLSAWPAPEQTLDFPEDTARMDGVMEMVRAIRNLRSQMNVQPGHRARLMVHAADGWEEVLRDQERAFARLAGVSTLTLLSPHEKPEEKTVSAVCRAGEMLIPLGELVDIAAEVKRLSKEKEKLLQEITREEGKLSNAGFLAKAPAQLVEAEKEKIAKNRQMLETLSARLAELQG